MMNGSSYSIRVGLTLYVIEIRGKSFAVVTEDQILRTCAIRRGGFQYPIGFMITVSM
jgi:hypothetical protein